MPTDGAKIRGDREFLRREFGDGPDRDDRPVGVPPGECPEQPQVEALVDDAVAAEEGAGTVGDFGRELGRGGERPGEERGVDDHARP